MSLEICIRKKLSHFTLEMGFCCQAGELLALVGPSGSGKTTVTRIIAGLEHPDIGSIRLGKKILYDTESRIQVPTRKRKLGYVFQEASLFPHLRIRDNVAFACDTPSRVDKLLDLLGISHLQNKKPARISGGERQRAAIAQSLAADPELLLLDEPFSALDVETRQSLQQKFLEIKKQLQIPIIMVTHNLQEASILGDQVIAVENGRTDTNWLARFHGILLPKKNKNTKLEELCCRQLAQA
ncbi:ATP-binding cassette domain-containing protein [Desulfotalea psychrophila]|uniref:ATP-binding cassette domain-containing protein n=1 Tax=Desulfotalea psychrophila TaxID=84980 RepID=A0ABS3AV00_9BACT|nr:ATP-binding cassette domain-containing protein [Desulfotalea psychrophila]